MWQAYSYTDFCFVENMLLLLISFLSSGHSYRPSPMWLRHSSKYGVSIGGVWVSEGISCLFWWSPEDWLIGEREADLRHLIWMPLLFNLQNSSNITSLCHFPESNHNWIGHTVCMIWKRLKETRNIQNVFKSTKQETKPKNKICLLV